MDSPVISFERNHAVVFGIGILTAAVWSFGFSKLHYFVYQALGSPEDPTTILWASLIIQSFLMGAIPGALIPFVSHHATLSNALVFLLAICAFVLLMPLIFGGVESVIGLITSYGLWAFIIGAIVGCLGAGYAKNAT
ncbi:MAG: hypothetical protein GY806_22275 [Gammaproteobacteria bacterium]|nr:hypothetical protein [Gammaproteobacteria bacterium]